jgi:hypothetical protein
MNIPFCTKLAATVLSLATLAACAAPAPPSAVASGQAFGAGFSVAGQVDAADLELPLYPGAQLLREGGEDKSAVHLQLWGGSLGFKLAAAKYHSPDEPEQVARFYRARLARLGTVLDCGAPDAPRGKSRDEGPLSCGNDRPAAGEQLYKVGQPRNFWVVAVKRPEQGGTQLSLVRVQLR